MEISLIAGLGNPGERYSRTRHNIGFRVIDRLCSRWKGGFSQTVDAALCEVQRNSRRVILVKPLTFMNRSGVVLSSLLNEYGLDSVHMLVIHDDVDLPLGQLRIRKDSGSGGHRGVESIIEHVASSDFTRIRIGVGRPLDDRDIVDFVLENFSIEEEEVVETIVRYASLSAESILEDGLIAAMNRYNKRLVN